MALILVSLSVVAYALVSKRLASTPVASAADVGEPTVARRLLIHGRPSDPAEPAGG